MKPWNNAAVGKRFVASFSGGKDSTLALFHATQQGTPLGMIVMLCENGETTGAHGLDRAFFTAQAEAMGIPVTFGVSDWAGYEGVFTGLLREYAAKGAEVLLTGDIDVPEHECWHERVTQNAGLGLAMPLWQHGHAETADEFLNAGFRTMVVSVNLQKGMKESDLGRILTPQFLQELAARGIDPCGESGEFHTAVLDGPLFHRPVSVFAEGTYEFRGYLYLKIRTEPASVPGQTQDKPQ